MDTKRLMAILAMLLIIVSLVFVPNQKADTASDAAAQETAKNLLANLMTGQRIEFPQVPEKSQGLTPEGSMLIDMIVDRLAPQAQNVPGFGPSVGAVNAPIKLKANLKVTFARSTAVSTKNCSGNDEAVGFTATFLTLGRNDTAVNTMGQEVFAYRTLLVETTTLSGNIALLRAYAREECTIALWEKSSTGLVYEPKTKKAVFRTILDAGWNAEGAIAGSQQLNQIDFPDLQQVVFPLPYRTKYDTGQFRLDVVYVGPGNR